MGRKSNQSVLKKLLDSVDSGDFKYESREKKVIDWSSIRRRLMRSMIC